jgi:4-azaleucine resistance transporter AzlC
MATTSVLPVGENASAPTPRAEFLAGMRGILPLVIGGAPFGFIFGALAVTNGIAVVNTLAMSAFVYAGSAQFIAANAVAAGTGVLVIVLTTLIVNARHILYAVTLAPHVKHLPQRWLLVLGFTLTDEAFAVAINRYNQPDSPANKHWYYLGASVLMYASWVLWSFIGIVAGQSIPPDQVARLGLGFAGSLTFIGMLVPQITSRPMLIAVLAASATALFCALLPGDLRRLGVIIAAVAGVLAGVLAERRLGND